MRAPRAAAGICLWLLFFISQSVPLLAADFGKTTTQKVADGAVYIFTTTGYGDVGLSGNSVAVISNDGVLVFDTSGTPATARNIIAEIKKITDKPVRYVVNSHWHWDHWGGNEAFKSAYPGVKIISQEKTRGMMQQDSIEWNRDYLGKDIPAHIRDVDDALAKAKADNNGDRAARLEALSNADKDFLHQKTTLTNTFPDEVYGESKRLKLGDMEIELIHARGITPGDTYVWLPKQKILLAADLLVCPIPYATGGTYPATWLAALQDIQKLGPNLIIPGHGPAENDDDFLRSNIRLFSRLREDVKSAKESGLSLQQTQDALKKNAAEYAAILKLDAKQVEPFTGLFLAGFVKNSYLELQGPLSDTPSK